MLIKRTKIDVFIKKNNNQLLKSYIFNVKCTSCKTNLLL